MALAEDDTDLSALTSGLLAEEPVEEVAPEVRAHEALLDDDAEDAPLRQVVGAGGVATLGVLFGLNLVDEFDRITLTILAPDIQQTFGVSDAALTLLANVGAVAVLAGAVPLGVLGDRRRRTTIVGITSLVWAAAAALGGMTRAVWQLALTRVFNGLGKGSGPVQASILADAYPLQGRGRVFAVHALANPVGNTVGPILAGVIATIAGGTEGWRWSLVVLAVPAAVLGARALLLPEPERGRHERTRALGAAEAVATGDAPTEAAAEVTEQISIGAGYERLRSIRTFAALLTGVAAVGLALSGAPTIVNLILEDRYELDALGRGVVSAIASVGGIVGLLVGGRAVDRLFRRDPAAVMKLIGGVMAVVAIAFPLSVFMPNVVLFVAVQAVVAAVAALPGAAINSVISVIVPARMRGLAYGMIGVYLVLVGGLVGGLVTGMLSDAVGQRFAIAIVMPVAGLAAAANLYRAHRTIRDDIDRLLAEIREERDEAELRRTGATDDLLQVRGVDFSYGQVQVLFDVDLSVRRGEVLALLGTNGAGKSTVLRAVSGLGTPSSGVIRFDGEPVTFADPATRVRAGIVQVAGGKAVFPTLTVRENLLAGAYTFIWDEDRVDERSREVLDLFPRLRERLDQPAGTLSGGEAQMLAIAKALMLDPRLLLIDELSLGLAPVVVQELLQVVERLRETGITIVIVEQSVNVALSVADRAVFMEKGQVRFEGPAQDLLERDDLVRAVFLGGEGG